MFLSKPLYRHSENEADFVDFARLPTLYLAIRLVVRKGYGSIANEAKPNGPAIDPWLLRVKGLIVLVSPNQPERKGTTIVSK